MSFYNFQFWKEHCIFANLLTLALWKLLWGYSLTRWKHLSSLEFALGFPESSVGKESACNAEDPSSIPGLGRCAGEEIDYPLQYSWAFLVAQLVKDLPGMRETWVWKDPWEDPLEKGKATRSSILAWRSPMGSQRVGHDWATFTFS